MGFLDYLNQDQKRVRVETQASSQDPVITQGIDVTDPALLMNYVSYVHTNAAGDGTHVMVATPANTLRLLLDIAIYENNNAPLGHFYTQRRGVVEMISERVAGAAAATVSNPLTEKYKPFILIPETSLGLVDSANGVGDTTTFRVRYVDIKIRW
jgi:hypothetical protein